MSAAAHAAPGVPHPSPSADLLAEVRGRLTRGGHPPSAEHVRDVVRQCGAVLGSRALAELVAAVRAEMLGAGPLQTLLDTPDVTDVLVNGPDDVWVERAGRLERVRVDLGSAEGVRALAVRLAAAAGQRLDDASPLADARLPDGTRLHAVLPPVGGPCTLLSLVPGDERIVCIEEAGELAPDHPHVVRLLTRRANVEGSGAVELPELVRQALRMRPDRIVLGECRGAEVREVLTALNTGHEGGWATVHANTAADVPVRLHALAALAGMDREAVAAQVASAVDAVVHLRRVEGRRRVEAVGVVQRDRSGELRVVTALRAGRSAGDRDDVSAAAAGVEPGPGWTALRERLGETVGAG